MTKSLYIHIPFCGNICWFCDFKRIKTNEYKVMHEYVDKIIKQIKEESQGKKYETIYIGGGTPNYLPVDLLRTLLETLSNLIDLNLDYEFCIECNPEYITEEQIKIFKQFNINRISLGVQTLNENILKKMNRKHNNQDVVSAINSFYKHNITNISLDFIYNYPMMSLKDLDDVFDFIIKYEIKHVSFYALEIKENAILKKQSYVIDEDNEAEQLLYLIKKFNEIHFKRYEVSNWCFDTKYESKHNKRYWDFEHWKGIGFGAYGYEGEQYYWYNGSVNHFNKQIQILSKEDIYQNKLMMGLRKKDGIDLNNFLNKKAFDYYKDKLKNYIITNENKLKAINIDCLNDVLIDIF